MKFKYLLMLSLCGALGFTACSDDDDPLPSPVPEDNAQEMTADAATYIVQIDATTPIQITAGNGEYAAFSLNPEIATVTMSGNTANVTGHANGNTKIVITDSKGKVINVPVTSFATKQLEVEGDGIEASGLVGTSASQTFKITKGNGEYSVSCANPSVSVSVNEAEETITVSAMAALEEYETEVVLKDEVKVAPDLKIKVHVTPTFDAFSDSQKASAYTTAARYGNNASYGHYYRSPIYYQANGASTAQYYQVQQSGRTYTYTHEKSGANHYKFGVSYAYPANNDQIMEFFVEFDGEIKEGAVYPCYYTSLYHNLWWHSIVEYPSKPVSQIEIYKVENGKVMAVVSFYDSYSKAMRQAYFMDVIPE